VKKSVLILAVVVAVLGAGCFAQSDQPSLADLAKQKKSTKKAVLKLSDEDFPPPSRTASDDSAARPSTSATAKAANKTDTPGKQSKSTTDVAASGDKRVNELKEKLGSYQKEEQVWKDSMKHYEELIVNEPSDFRRQMYQDALDNDKHNAALYHQKVEEIQNELAKPQPKLHANGDSSTGGGQL
jgi:hypothetical protein